MIALWISTRKRIVATVSRFTIKKLGNIKDFEPINEFFIVRMQPQFLGQTFEAQPNQAKTALIVCGTLF
jgi:hypothetical protein